MTLQDDGMNSGGSDAPESSPGQSAGAQLRALREAAQMSADDVAQQLKLSRRQVLAIENDELDALPGPTFVRGFIRNYARLLRVDPEPLLQASSVAVPASEPMQPIARSMGELPQEDGSAPSWTKWLIPAGLVIVLIGGIAVYELTDVGAPARRSRKEAAETTIVTPPAIATPGTAEPAAAITQPTTTPSDGPAAAGTSAAPAAAPAPARLEAAAPVTPASTAAGTSTAAGPGAKVPDLARAGTPPIPTVTAQTGPAPAGAMAVAPIATGQAPRTEPSAAAGGARVDLEFAAPSWVEVRDARGEVLVSRTLQGAQSVSGTPPLSLRIGNAGAVSLRYNGEPVDIKPFTRQEIARLTLPAAGRRP